MNVLHINTFDVGGAAVAALRLHNGLLYSGVESAFLSLYKGQPENSSVIDYNVFLRTAYKARLFSSFKYRIQKVLFKKVNGFNYPFSPYNVHEHPLIKEADIVHLHWVSGFVNLSTFVPALKKLGKPIVWTLHDLNPITGGYHYFGPDRVNLKLNAKFHEIKKNIFKSYDNIHLVSPSTWIYDLILESGFVGKKNTHQIRNGLNLKQFFPVKKAKAKTSLNIKPSKKVVLFLAADILDKRKGLSYFLKSIEFIRNKEGIQFICVGSGRFEVPLGINLSFVGNVNDTLKLVNLYSAADIFVIPSIEDNLPNTIIESLGCGTPVVGFNTGGIPDLIKENYNGFLAQKGNEVDLAEKLNLLLDNSHLLENFSKNARSFAEEYLTDQNQSRRYIELYRSILNEN